MKFLGVDTEILGNSEACLFILNNLKELEKKMKLFLNPKYLAQYYFVIAINHDIINVVFDNSNDNQNDDQNDDQIRRMGPR